MSLSYVPLDRVFHAVSEKELEDVEALLAIADSTLDLGGLDWEALLEFPRVLILAQGGVGKTREMQEQATRLTSDGQSAFFMALERLDGESITEVLGFDEGDQFEAWLKHEDSIGWFFLDSIDELKISHGTLERALRKFANALGRDALQRARVILSCRPWDWSETIDRPAVQSTLALPASLAVDFGVAEDAFVASLKNDRQEASGNAPDEEGLKVVMLLPLDRKRTWQFAEAIGTPDVASFMDEVTRRNADELVKRPMDLIATLDMWRDHRRLGTRQEQLNINIASNLIESEGTRHKRGALSLERALGGVKRLALAMVLAKRSTIHAEAPSVGRAPAANAISVEKVLNDWAEDERARLLRLPIFDLAALGQVRFHHRSIKDFLAAERLDELNRSNLSDRELRRLFIREKFGETVLVPYMRDVAAWLALRNDRFRVEVQKTAPQVLISHGDPEALPLREREELLSAVAQAHGAGGWRGLGFDITQMRRLADPDLGSVVRKVWSQQHENEEILDLLVDMIWHGPLSDCADLAESVAFDPTVSDGTRAAAVRALIACDSAAAVRRFVEEVLINTSQWSGRPFCYLFIELVPNQLSISELIGILQDIIPAQSSRSDLSWEINEVVAKLVPQSEEANDFRDGLCHLIEGGAGDDIEEYSMKSQFGELAEPLAALCARQIEAGIGPSGPLTHACVIASRFEKDGYSSSSQVNNLAKNVRARELFQEAVYWEDVAVLGRLFPDRDASWRAWRSSSDRALVTPLGIDDAPWLERALASNNPERRLLALHRLLDIWRQGGSSTDFFVRIQGAISDSPELTDIANNALKPIEEPERFRQSKERLARRERATRANERLRIADWQDWKHLISANPVESFGGDEEDSNVINVVKWMAMHTGRQVSDGPWSTDAFLSMFGENVYRHALPALKRYWRKQEPRLWSERTTEKRSTYFNTWMYGLCAVKAEASEPGWIDQLTDEEVCLATRYALIQFNGCPEYLDQLMTSRPEPIFDLLSNELHEQSNAWNELAGDLPLLQTVKYGSETARRQLAPVLTQLLKDWPIDFTEEDAGRSLHGLSHLIDILCDVCNEAEAPPIIKLAKKRFEANRDGLFAGLWLRAIFRLDFESGVDLLTRHFRDPKNQSESERVESLIAGLFGDRDFSLFQDKNVSSRAQTLGRLLRFSYEFIRPEQDIEHHGVFSPGTRDHAENGRSAIFSALLETPGAEARHILLSLADEPRFSHIADRWRMLSLEKLALQAELEPYDIDAIRDFERRHEFAPRNSGELLDVAVGRIIDLAHDLHHYKFSMLKVWRRIDDEPDAQGLLAARLAEKQRNAYTAVTREEEVAEQNRTDITLSTLDPDADQVTIEIKIANKNRSANNLAKDIDTQLVDKYLRHKKCHAGCFLVINRGDRSKWQHPDTQKMVSFSEVIDFLENRARMIEKRHEHKIKLAVYGLDLTDNGKKRHAL